MRCKFVLKATKEGRNLLHCPLCDGEVWSRSPPEKTARTCIARQRLLSSARCDHLGREVRREKCNSCSGNVVVKIFECHMLLKDTTIRQCNNCDHHSGLVVPLVSPQPPQQGNSQQ